MNEVAVNLEVGVAVDDVGVALVDVSTPTCALTEDACSDDVGRRYESFRARETASRPLSR